MLYLVVDFVNDFVVCLQFEQRYFEVAGALDVGQDERIQVHGSLITIEWQYIVDFSRLFGRLGIF